MPPIKALVSVYSPVNGIWIPLPAMSEYEANTATIVDAARNSNGDEVGAVIKSGVSKVTLKWNFLTPSDWQGVLALFANSFYNKVRFYNQDTANWSEKIMYVSDRSATMFRRNPMRTHPTDPLQDYPVMGWKGCRIALIQAK